MVASVSAAVRGPRRFGEAGAPVEQRDQRREQRRQLRDPSFGQQSVADSTRAAVQGALPDFLSNLGGLKEQNIRRGISTGA